MIVVKKFVFNPFQENTYVVWDEDTSDAIVIDPGCVDQNEEKILAVFISTRNLQIKYLINTHCHIDHIFGCRFIKEKFNAVYYAPKEDLPLLEHSDKQAAAFGMEIEKPPLPDKYISESLSIRLGSSPIKFLFTPGHSPGEYCIYFEKENFCITGDVLFRRSIGRTDLYGGDYNTLLNSIREKLFSLPDKVLIYPGHGDNSTIGEEKRENPFLNN